MSENLDGTRLAIVKELWREYHAGNRHGLTVKTLKSLIGRSSVSIQTAINELSNQKPPLLHSQAALRDLATKGRNPLAYSIDKKNMVT